MSQMAYSSAYHPTSLGQRKVAIPRLQRAGQGHNTAKDRRRVNRACTACRSHKIKCTGERPHCKHCATTNRECIYIMPRKDRLKIVTDRCQQMAALLKGLQTCASSDENAKIADILEAVEEEITEARPMTEPSNADTDTHTSQEGKEFSSADSPDEVDTESLDLLDEDLHRDDRARATGFVGKNSEIQWLRTVAIAQMERSEEDVSGITASRRGSLAPGSEQVSTFSYWTDGDNVDVDFYVDPYEFPQPEVAERLLHCYMTKVHDSFPILPRTTFEDQFRKYFTAWRNGNAPRLSPKWQAILNLVFAIGAKYSHLTKSSWRADDRDHLVYQARARAFGLNESTITNHSDIPQIQSLGLLAFYWLSVGQISRAWTIIGLALRFAYALGLHVRNEDPSATAFKRETLVRTWWSLYSLERQLSIVTGRPSIIVDSCCSVPLPLPFAEENISDEAESAYRVRKGSTAFLGTHPTFSVTSNGNTDSSRAPAAIPEPNSGSYFKAVVQLSIITQSILTSLYSAGTMIRSPGEIQQDILQLNQRLDQWINSLSAAFNFQERPIDTNDAFTRERMLLGFQFCSARILLTRPCLTGKRQPWREGNETGFAQRMADVCIDAAKTVLAFLPDEPQPTFVYDQGPWWSIVHHLTQAISVFLLGLCYPSSTSHESLVLIQCTKKATRWLQMMQDPVADRAYQIVMNLFESVARRHSIDVSELWNMTVDNNIAVRRPTGHHQVTDFDISAYLPTQFVPMTQSPPTNVAMASYAAYDSMTSGAVFPATHHRTPIFNDNYYVAR